MKKKIVKKQKRFDLKTHNFFPIVLSIITIISITFGIYFHFEKKFALAEEVRRIEQRLDYKIKSDIFNATQQRIWQIEDRFKNIPMDTTTAEELRKLQIEKEELKKELDVIRNQKIK